LKVGKKYLPKYLNIVRFIADNGNKLLQNGFPCGWKGDYPEGKMIVFSNE